MPVTAQEKACKDCGETKPLSEFGPHPTGVHGARAECRDCYRAKRRGYYRRWTPEQRMLHRERVLRSRYGLTVAQVHNLYESQEGCCAICGAYGDRPAVHEKRRSAKDTLCVDHDHETGEVRGLLCTTCNKGLGAFADDARRLILAASYLLRRGDAPSL